jgi:hypothetical protein
MKITSKQKPLLDKVIVMGGEWSINSDTDFIDVEGSVDMSYMYLTNIPVKFGEVTGDFNCSGNQLTSMVGAPQSVWGLFYIDLSYIYNKYYHVIIPEIEEMLGMGIKFHYPYISFVEKLCFTL